MTARKRQIFGRTALFAALLAAVPLGTVTAAACSTPLHTEAVAVRILQSELTVGALACDQRSQYATFIERHAPTLREYGSMLTQYFTDRYGEREGQRALDAYVTRLANEASTRKSGWTSHYCLFVSALHDQATSLPRGGLGSFASRQPQARRLGQHDLCP